jgi:hypothetical protein
MPALLELEEGTVEWMMDRASGYQRNRCESTLHIAGFASDVENAYNSMPRSVQQDDLFRYCTCITGASTRPHSSGSQLASRRNHSRRSILQWCGTPALVCWKKFLRQCDNAESSSLHGAHLKEGITLIFPQSLYGHSNLELGIKSMLLSINLTFAY